MENNEKIYNMSNNIEAEEIQRYFMDRGESPTQLITCDDKEKLALKQLQGQQIQRRLIDDMASNMAAIDTSIVQITTANAQQQQPQYQLKQQQQQKQSPILTVTQNRNDVTSVKSVGSTSGGNNNTIGNCTDLRDRCRKAREILSNKLQILEAKASKCNGNVENAHISHVPQQIQNAEGISKANSAGNRNRNNNSNTKNNNNNRENTRPLTRRELQSIIEGLQQLLLSVTVNNKNLQNQTINMAKSIPQLKNFQLFGQLPPLHKRFAKSSGSINCNNDNINGNHKYDLDEQHDSEISSGTGEMQVQMQKNLAQKAVHGTEAKPRKRNRKSNRKRETTQATEEGELVKYINDIIAGYLGEHQKEKINMFKFTKDHLLNLEAYAQTLVEAGFGRIVEEEIRINRKNNRQAFVTLSTDRETGERDGFILLPVARRYAFEGDIVRAFVLNPGTDECHHHHHSTKSNQSEQESKKNKNDNNNDNNHCNGNKRQKKLSNSIMGGQNYFSVADGEDLCDDTESSPDTELEDIVDTLPIIDNCPKAFVIRVVTQTPKRQVVGVVNFKSTSLFSNNKTYYKLRPHDMRMPILYVPVESCAQHVIEENKNDIGGYLYLAQILETDANGHCIGELLQSVGKVGILKNETKAILFQNGFKDLKAYDQKYDDMYNGPISPINEEQLRLREDLRQKCIFTIDPLTARDLDDAMSIEILDNGDYEVGVHISDVSHYLLENSELDNLVKDRATSVYLVNEVIHMLPQSLCYKCSLLPGEDKFTFSVFWNINDKAEIINRPRFVRSIIKSCTQFAYEHAQKIIDHPTDDFSLDDFPEIFNNWTPSDIKWRILALHELAQKMKAKRYENGAISINNPKLRFTLDPLLGEPLSYEVEDRQEAHFLIEELMLLANQSVAKFIYEHFPEMSILRHHAPPLMKSMKALRDRLLAMGIDFDISSSKTVYASMKRLCESAADPKAIDACLNTLLTKPMARARYFCSEGRTLAEFWHYALSVPIYTHFTSPIRRYPDILVHRLLAAALTCGPIPQRSTNELHQLAKICNDQKFNAKNAGDDSINLFFKRYIKSKQPITFKTVVIDIFQHLMNVVIIETGHTIAINYKSQKVLVNTSQVPQYVLIMEKNSTKPPMKLQLFSTLEIKLVVLDDKLYGFIVSPDPKQRYLNSLEKGKHHQLQQQQLKQQPPRDEDYYMINDGDEKPQHSLPNQQIRNCLNGFVSESENTTSGGSSPSQSDAVMLVTDKKRRRRRKPSKNSINSNSSSSNNNNNTGTLLD